MGALAAAAQEGQGGPKVSNSIHWTPSLSSSIFMYFFFGKAQGGQSQKCLCPRRPNFTELATLA